MLKWTFCYNYQALDKTYTFVYNEGGNIISKNEYVYTEGELGTPTKIYTYVYGNAWKDQLTYFDGSSIVYDASGNPTSYLGATLTWSRGRLLTHYTKGSINVAIQYDANGIRMSKQKTSTYTNVNTTYKYDSNGRLRTETQNGVTRRYLYSSDGIVGYEQDGERFLYRKNLFGDIIAIYKGTTKVAEYTYDAWGNCTIVYNMSGYATLNPFRYRGYYWDEDLKMYYLMTRYYDPKTGRFINSDSFEYLEPNKINGLNLYAYCRNNPIMYIDPYGTDISYDCNTDEGYDPEEDLFENGGGGGGGNSSKTTSNSNSGYANSGYGGGTYNNAYNSGNSYYGPSSSGGRNSVSSGKTEVHHVVEQCQTYKSGFSNSAIQAASNKVVLDYGVHRQVSGYYSSKQKYTGGVRVRDWLVGQSFEFQTQFGWEIVRTFRGY